MRSLFAGLCFLFAAKTICTSILAADKGAPEDLAVELALALEYARFHKNNADLLSIFQRLKMGGFGVLTSDDEDEEQGLHCPHSSMEASRSNSASNSISSATSVTSAAGGRGRGRGRRRNARHFPSNTTTTTTTTSSTAAAAAAAASLSFSYPDSYIQQITLQTLESNPMFKTTTTTIGSTTTTNSNNNTTAALIHSHHQQRLAQLSSANSTLTTFIKQQKQSCSSYKTHLMSRLQEQADATESLIKQVDLLDRAELAKVVQQQRQRIEQLEHERATIERKEKLAAEEEKLRQQQQQKQEEKERLEEEKRKQQQQQSTTTTTSTNINTTTTSSSSSSSVPAVVEAEPYLSIYYNTKRVIKPAVKADRQLARMLLMNHKMKIIQTVGQVMNSRRTVDNITATLTNEFNFGSSHSPQIYDWIMDLASKTIIRQAEKEVAVKRALAFPLAVIVSNLIRAHPRFQPLFLGRMHARCVHTLPHIPARLPNEPNETYLQRALGYKRKDVDLETIEQYSERMCGILAVYLAVLQMNETSPPPSRGGGVEVVWGMKRAWVWVARFLNMKPKLISPHLLLVFFEIVGPRLIQTYGTQARKLVQFVGNVYIPMMPSDSRAATTRLLLFLEEYTSRGGRFVEMEGARMDR